jgi:hypothetical protein
MSDNNSEKKQENIVGAKDGKEIKTKKLGFFKKVWYSITKFEKYVEMSLEGTSRAVKYLLQITSIFVLIIAIIGGYSANVNLNGLIKNIENNIPDFKYSEGQIALDADEENKVYTLQDTNLNFGKVIIDLNTEDEGVISEYESTIKNNSETNNVGFIILKDKVIQVIKLVEGMEGESRISMTYDEVMQKLFGSTNVEITKTNLVEYLNGNGRTSVLIVNFFSYFIAYFIIYISSGLIYASVLGLIGYASVKISKIKLTFAQLFAMSVYAFTLSNVLNMIYFIVNYFAGITIKYFDIAYIAIAYIYLVAVIFLIKLDNVRKQENQAKNEKKEEKEKTDGQEQI